MLERTHEFTGVLLAALTAILGGLVGYFRRIQNGERPSWASGVMATITSGFAGLLCWLGCVQLDVPPAITAICTGLAGHAGVEFLRIIEERFQRAVINHTGGER